MNKRHLLSAWLAPWLLGFVLVFSLDGPARAQDDQALRIGLLLPLTGPFSATGKQLEAGARLYLAQHGDTVAGRKVQLIVKDDMATPDVAKRLAQELLVTDKVHVLAGFGLTPLAFAVAPMATQTKTPMVVMAAATSSITEASPYIVRSSFTVPQVVLPLADWARQNRIRRVVSLVSDYAPGIDSEKYFKERFTDQGGTVVETLRVPLRNPDFAPFLQKVRDLQPDALFTFVPAGVGAVLIKQFTERGLPQAGIRIIAEGSVTDDDLLNSLGDEALGIVTAHHYSAAHDSPVNRAYVAAFQKAVPGARPNFMAVGAYDGMHVIMEALRKTQGNTSGEALLAAMKGLSFDSPRGPVRIDPETRDVIHNIYIRRVERRKDLGNQLYNMEIATIPNVKDPGKPR
ncbi:ABC transporter substrate-binding protein [Hylemonella gracilis]|jgi:branched-chain amino acid transport system substrate-binding protein|uniref:ABC transporter substrate-binding protein n=1 Tax=Hylemonella gracilis TaxID=80880 RepID=A0A4P6UK70_9BURK|nr:ABC transporter substrate-binding protein [Hylemonella gracilis]QBK04976.1 ABC transporter substrate-binding protein [Hylemonella gracilis]